MCLYFIERGLVCRSFVTSVPSLDPSYLKFRSWDWGRCRGGNVESDVLGVDTKPSLQDRRLREYFCNQYFSGRGLSDVINKFYVKGSEIRSDGLVL